MTINIIQLKNPKNFLKDLAPALILKKVQTSIANKHITIKTMLKIITEFMHLNL